MPDIAKSSPQICHFNDCENAAVDGTNKCSFHRNRRQCIVDQCTNQVYARRLCVRHGGKKQCEAEGCDAHARGGGFCTQHGGHVVKRFCIVDGCKKQAHARQKCVRHGGGRHCRIQGCSQHARAGGLCNRHSHGHECAVAGCKKTAQHLSSICFRHAMELRARGETVPKMNIARGSRTTNKHRPLLDSVKKDPNEKPHLALPYLPSPIAFNDNNSAFPLHANDFQTIAQPLQQLSYLSASVGSFQMSKPNVLGNRFHDISSFGLHSSGLDSRANTSTSGAFTSTNYTSNESDLFSSRPFLRSPTNGMYSSLASEFPFIKNDDHKHGEDEDLDSILTSYSRIISPSAISPIAFSRDNASYIVPLTVDRNDTEKANHLERSTLDTLETTFSSIPPPSLVRLNSLLPPPPGTVMGNIPLPASFSFDTNKTPSSKLNGYTEKYLNSDYFMDHHSNLRPVATEIAAE